MDLRSIAIFTNKTLCLTGLLIIFLNQKIGWNILFFKWAYFFKEIKNWKTKLLILNFKDFIKTLCETINKRKMNYARITSRYKALL